MCKYLLDLIGFNVDKPEDYYDRKLQLSTLHIYKPYRNKMNKKQVGIIMVHYYSVESVAKHSRNTGLLRLPFNTIMGCSYTSHQTGTSHSKNKRAHSCRPTSSSPRTRWHGFSHLSIRTCRTYFTSYKK